MSTTDPFTPEARRFSTWMLRAVLFLTITGLFALPSQGRPPLDDADVLKYREQLRLDEGLLAMRAQLQEGANPASEPMNARQQALHTAIFGQGPNAVAAKTLLETRLGEKIASVDRICGLTSVQNEKLQLVGRGDIKRFLDRIDSLQLQLQGPETDDERDIAWAEGLKVEAANLRRTFKSGLFEDGSMFAKILKKTLTADQAAACDKARPMLPEIGVVRWIDPVGRKVWIALGEADGVKPGTTYRIRKNSRAQRIPGKPDAAPREAAIKGTIEVIRVVGEDLSEARILADDIVNPIAKGDTIVPRRPGER